MDAGTGVWGEMSLDEKFVKAGNRKIDGLGRITIPKNMRDKLGVVENDEFEIGTTIVDGETIIYLRKENLGQSRKEQLSAELKAMGVEI